MGGLGSGRLYQSDRRTTNDCLHLSISELQRNGQLTPGQQFGLHWAPRGEITARIQIKTEHDKLRLIYKLPDKNGERQVFVCPVMLDWSQCNLGGRRQWFLCPMKGCSRRVGNLYQDSTGFFICRHCNNLAYASQRESTYDQLPRKANKIRRRLGWQAGIANERGTKPVGMHWKTYHRLIAEHDALLEAPAIGLPNWSLSVLNRSRSVR